MQESLNTSLVRIRTVDREVVGAGFLVGERHILTCAHVVNQALNLADYTVDPPQGVVSLDFPLLVPPRPLLTARVVLWSPPLSDERGDIAGLVLQGEPPAGTEVVRFAPAEAVWEHSFSAIGFPAGSDDGVWATGRLMGRQATGWVQIEGVKAQGYPVGPGFSGTPVWDTQLQGVVGMVVAASRQEDTRAAFVLPPDVLAAAWPLIEPVTHQRIFLSAAPADAAFAARLATDLAARGIVVWNDQHTPGEDSADKKERVRQAIRAAQAVVLVVSSQTRSSRTVKEHLHLANDYKRRLILVWVGDDQHTQPQQYSSPETVWVDAHDSLYAVALDAIEANLSQRRSILALLGPPDPPEEEPRNPYKGLLAFTTDDAGDFFGRESLIDDLVKDVARVSASEHPAPESGRLLAILGPCGSGKSSVVMAGLLPRLQRGALPGSEKWVFLSPMVPGKDPIEALGLTLAVHFPGRDFISIRKDLEDDATRGLHVLAMQLVKQRGSRVVLLVDQFEELFTQTESEDERQRFIDLLLVATTEPQGPLLVLLTLRADFYDRLMQYPALSRLVQAQQRQVLPMEVEDLRATIERPAALSDVQLTFEGNLVGDLLFEVQGQRGALPLLQFTLDQLFQKRSGHRLTLSAYYRDIGGVKGALSRHAEQTYAALPSEEHRRQARALFLRLIDPGASEQDTTRRRAVLSEFSLADPTTTRLLRETADAFIAARLLTAYKVDETISLEVSHEAVIRAWILLAKWVREAREDLHLLQVIRADAAEWQHSGRSVDRLYRGTQLAEALAWRERSLLNLDEEAFLEASVSEQERQQAHAAERQQQEARQQTRYENLQRRHLRQRRALLGGLVVAAAAIGVGGFVGVWWERTNRLFLFTPHGNPICTYPGHSPGNRKVYGVAWSPDGKRIASASDDQTVQIWDAANCGRPSPPYKHKAPVVGVAWSPDGKRIASASDDGMVQIWDATTGKTIKIFSGLSGHTDSVHSVAWSPDGRYVASGSNDRTVRVWDTLAKTAFNVYKGHSSYVWNVAWSPDGTQIASASSDKTVHIWDPFTGVPQVYSKHTDWVHGVAWSPNGLYIASGGRDTTVQVWDAATQGKQFSYIYTGHADNVDTVAWSHDGHRIASGGGRDNGPLSSIDDHTVQVWDALDGGNLLVYTGHTTRVHSLAWAPDRTRRIVSGSDDGTVQVWHAS